MSSWARTRQRGRRRFIITRGLLLFGLSFGITFFLLGVLLFEPRDPLRASLYIPGFLVFGWLWGDYLWSRRERAFERYTQAQYEHPTA
jgi:hypothetical protein